MRDENVGRVLAHKYELIRLLGKGGMGAVYEGRNPIGKRVAVKLLLQPEYAKNRTLTARFFREAQASAAAESRHVVDVYDTGVDEDTGIPFIIMAFLQGEDLEQVIERLGALNPLVAARIATQALTGLAKAHEVGIVHRDIKPANIFLATEEGESTVKLLDFGIAKLTTDQLAPSADAGALTRTGALLGTPAYMSPEQAQGLKTIDIRTDIWSLGMCLYRALAGRLPFGDIDTIGQLIVAIVARDLPQLTSLAPWVSPELAAVVHRALDRDMNKRFSTAREFVAALRPFTGGAVTIDSSLLVGVGGALDATISPEVAATVAAAPLTPAVSTTGGAVVRERKPASSSSRALLVAAGVVVVVGVGLGVRGLIAKKEAPPPAVVASAPPSVAPAALPPATIEQEEAVKVGTLAIKMPPGSTVKVDGAPQTVEGGKLTLRGEFQRKFLVAVYDASGKRLMVQDVYLYDNKVDPESIDTNVGAVVVEKPKRKAPSAPAGSASQASQGAPSAPPAAASSGVLPPRF